MAIIVSLGFFSASALAEAARERSRNNKQFVLGKAHCVHSAVMYRAYPRRTTVPTW